MSKYDLIIQNGTVVTAADTVRCDIGIKEGIISNLADHLTVCSTACAKDCYKNYGFK